MRDSCTKCARKHLAQAIVLLHEARLGYPMHYYIAMGHMAEASDELVLNHYGMAAKIREERLALEEDRNYIPPLLDLIGELEEIDLTASATLDA